VPFATVYLADFLVWVLQRQTPALRPHQLLVQSEGRVAGCSAALRQQGVQLGWCTERAQTLAPEALVRPAPGGAVQQLYWEEVLWQLNGHTPWLEALRPGLAVARFEDRPTLRRLAGVLEAQVGVASSRTTSHLAALATPPGRLRWLQPSQEAAFRERLPITHLVGVDVGEEEAQRLLWLGFSTVGSLARLSRAQLTARFPESGPRLYDLAQGRGDQPVATFVPPPTIHETHGFETPCCEPAEVLPVLAVLATRATVRLEDRQAGSVTVKLERAEGMETRRRLLRVPASAARTVHLSAALCWEDLCRQALRRSTPWEIERVSLVLGALARCPVRQGGLWETRARVEKAVAAVEARHPGSLFRVGVSTVPSLPEESWYRINPRASA
jgi:DNA polymerase-4